MTEAIGARSFTQSDIDWFAAASGDYNPIHVDPVLARRLITGGTVVHGMYTLLWMIERHFENGGTASGRLTAYFPRPVKAGDALELLREPEGGGVRLMLMQEGVMAATVSLEGDAVAPAGGEEIGRRLALAAPDELPFSVLKGLSGQTLVAWDSADLQSEFPLTAGKLGEQRVAAIMALSRLVGMQAPGLHSIFTGIAVAFDDRASGQDIDWQVSRASVPVAPIRITVAGGGLSGHADAVVRPAPVAQPQMQALREAVVGNEFAGQRALVVGGSRGLGELVAKLVVAGGGEVVISYLAGVSDAERVVSDITAWGGKCTAIPLDIADSATLRANLGRVGQDFTHVYYFPTPRITRGPATGFDRVVFNRFTDIYVVAFDSLVLALSEHRSAPLKVFYPSTSFIDELPPGFSEYVAAKAAGEAHCRYLSRTLKHVDIQVRRLPRLGTDQTASLIPQPLGSALDSMLETVRALQGTAMSSDHQ